jgi:hypothetical protein
VYFIQQFSRLVNLQLADPIPLCINIDDAAYLPMARVSSSARSFPSLGINCASFVRNAACFYAFRELNLGKAFYAASTAV